MSGILAILFFMVLIFGSFELLKFVIKNIVGILFTLFFIGMLVASMASA